VYWNHEYDLLGPCNVIGHGSRDHSIPQAISYWWCFGTKPLSLTVSEIFNGECDAMVDMTLNDL